MAEWADGAVHFKYTEEKRHQTESEEVRFVGMGDRQGGDR